MSRSALPLGRLAATAAVLLLAAWLAWPDAPDEAPRPDDAPPAEAGAPHLVGRASPVRAESPPAPRPDPEPASEPTLPRIRRLRGEAPNDGVRVTGRVLLAGTGTPVEGATVQAWICESREVTCDAATTDAEGRFTLQPVATRQAVWVVARAPGLHPVAATVTLTADEEDLVIEVGAGGTLEGRVTNADATPAAGADVWLVRPGLPLPPRREPRQWFIGLDHEQLRRFYFPRAATDEDGRYAFRGVPVAEDRLPVVRLSDVADVPGETVRFEADGETIVCDVTLPALAALTVRALDAEGAAASDAQIDLESPRIWFTLREEGRPNDDGSVTVQGLVPGTWTVRAWLPGAGRIEREVVLAPGGRETVVLRPDAGAVLEGQVVDARGDPVAGARLVFTGPATRFDRADEEGRFRLTGLPAAPGTLEVEAGHAGSDLARWQAGLSPIRRSRPLAPMTLPGVVPGGPPLRAVLPDGGRIQGTLRGLAPGTELEVLVLSRRKTGHGRREVPEDGVYRCDAPRPGDPCLLAFRTKDGRCCLRAVPALAVGADHDLGEIVLEPGVELAGRVVGASGEALENARVRLTQRWTDRETRTDARGAFAFAGLPRAEVWARVDARGYPPAFRVLEAGTGTAQEIALSEGGILELCVVDVDGAPVTEGTFSIRWKLGSDYDADHDGLFDVFRLDASGTTRLRREAATYELFVGTESYDQGARVEAAVREGETTALEVRLERTPR